MQEKINFKQRELVQFDIDGNIKGTGKICGKTSDNAVTIWIVEIVTGNISKEVYPYSHIGVPHCLLKRV